MTELRTREGVAARALEFAILTAARTGEVIGARWHEIDLAARTWTVPAGRMKGAREHRVPLSDRAIEILSEVYREDGNPHVFVGPSAGSGLSNMAMGGVLKHMGRGDITVHGFRVDISRLGRGVYQLPQPRDRDGAGACHRQRRGEELPARRSLQQARAIDAGVGCLLQQACSQRRCCAVAGAQVKAIDPTLPPWKASTERDRKALMNFTLAELLRYDALVEEEDFEKHDHYALNKLPSPPARDLPTAAKAEARRGNLKPLRTLYPEIAEFIAEPKRKRGERRPPDPFARITNTRWVADTVRRVRQIWSEHYGGWKRPSTDTLMIEIVAKYLELSEAQVRRALKQASR